MEIRNYVLVFPTTGKTDLVDITREVSLRVRESGLSEGSVLIFVPGSTAALTTIEYESGVIGDLEEAIARLASENLHYRHDARELDYYFAYPEDYSQQSIEWIGGEFGRRPHNPAFEVIYVYSQREESLDLHFRGSYKALERLQAMFTTAILKLEELPPDPKDERIYDLSPLLQRSFNFNYDVGSGIEEVTVKQLRLASRMKKGDRITLEADASRNSDAVYDLLDGIARAVPLNMYSLTQVELSASVAVDSGKPAKRMTIRITYPNSCSLKYNELGLKLRDMLEAFGIEPKEPAKGPEGKTH